MARKPSKQAEELKKLQEQQQKASTRHRGIIALCVFLLGAAAVVSVGIWAVGWDRVLANRENPETEDAYGDGDTVFLTARVAGYITSTPVDDNMPVHAGEVVMTVEDDNYQAQVAAAQASVQAAMAAVASLQQQVRAAREQLAQAEATAGASRAQQRFTADEAVRQHVILPTALGLLRTTQQADSQNGQARAAIRRNDSLVEEAKRQILVNEAQVAEAQAAVRVQQARLELARINLHYATIRAPRDGLLGMRQVHVGDLVQAGRAVATLTPLDNVWVTANFNEKQLQHIRVGQRAELRFDAYPNVNLQARVTGLSPLTGQQLSAAPPDNTTGNYTKVPERVPVKIEIVDQPSTPLFGLIRPGMSVLARVDTEGSPGVRTAR